jgi:cytochrome c-type biogenesis protein CcmF
MLIEAGHFALALALGVSLLQVVLPLWGSRANDRVLMGLAGPTALASFALVAFSFAALTVAHLTSDFSVANVVEHSHTAKPLIYKLSGVWGNHEGSMLLWVAILSLFGALVALNARAVPFALRTTALAVQGGITAAFQLFILCTSNPFRRIVPPPAEGQDLNPLLQDIGLAIHPPLLYLGYVGFSMTYAFAMAALIDGRLDAVWARAVRPWALLAWSFLTLGIAMGAYWAYYELGWGGFWFWDPVENASLMPWLAGTALVHSIVVMEKREALKVWTVLLAILTFSLSLLGTFLVRSGILTSVHSFAVDPGRGVATGRPVRAHLARGRARAQQPPARLGLRHRVHRHALPARPRGADGREDLRWCALLRPDLRPPRAAAALPRALRPAPRLEAG